MYFTPAYLYISKIFFFFGNICQADGMGMSKVKPRLIQFLCFSPVGNWQFSFDIWWLILERLNITQLPMPSA